MQNFSPGHSVTHLSYGGLYYQAISSVGGAAIF